MAFTSIDNFRSEVKGIARSTLFSVDVVFPNFDTKNFSFTCKALYAISRKERLTLIELLSLKYLRISPIIIGTA